MNTANVTGVENITLQAGSTAAVTNQNGAGVTITAGAASTVVLGTGGQIFVGSAGNDNITGGSGADTLNLTSGGSDVVRVVATEDNTTPYGADTVTGFTVNADRVSFSITDVDANAGTSLQFAKGGADITAALGAGTAVVTAVAANAGAVALHTANAADIIKLSDLTATSFATAMGTTVLGIDSSGDGDGTNDFAAGEAQLITWYDSGNARAVIGYVEGTTTDLDVINGTSAFVTIATIGMTSADYTAMSNQSFLFA